MSKIPDETIQKVKDAAGIVDVIGDFYDLRADGPNIKTCLCPFHADKHMGSFKVSAAKNIYHCFSCGAHGGPVDFLMQHEKMKFDEAIRWLGAKYGIMVEGSEQYHPRKAEPHKPVPPLPMLTLPREMVQKTMAVREGNTLVKWLRSLNWNEQQRRRIDMMLKNYLVGHGKQGHTIFWQVDEQGRIHTGKMMCYKPDGHRYHKEEKVDASNWIHAKLYRAGTVNPMDYDARPCYFGLHLLPLCPDATINIVESEKTALICAIAYGDMKRHLWVATGGLQFLTKDKMQPLIAARRKVVLYPDRDGVERWRELANSIGYDGMMLNTSIIDKYWKEIDGPKADIADIILRLIAPGETERQLKDMAADNPAINTLIEAFDLDIIKN